MDTAWVQVFVLTLSECVAPAGKTVCQQQQFELEFLTRRDCEYALQQLVSMKDELEHVIVDHARSGCSVSARETDAYANADAVRDASSDRWRDPPNVEQRSTPDSNEHRERLAGLESCEETEGTAPCKIGDIIVEEATGDSVDVWRRGP